MIYNVSDEFNEKNLKRYYSVGLEEAFLEYEVIQKFLEVDNVDNSIFIDQFLALEQVFYQYLYEIVKRNVFGAKIWNLDLSDNLARECESGSGGAVLPGGESAPST